jgi:calmodulin
MAQLGSDVSDVEVAAAFEDMDADGNGVVDFDEFTVWYVKSEMRLKVEINKAFEKLDKDGDGYIDAEELKVLVQSMDADVTDGDVTKLMEVCMCTCACACMCACVVCVCVCGGGGNEQARCACS